MVRIAHGSKTRWEQVKPAWEKWRAENPEAFREMKRKAKEREWEKNPERMKARVKLKYAVANGLIFKPMECTRCFQQFEKVLIHGHHWHGYEDALDVQWLCYRCHREEHIRLVAEEAMVKGREQMLAVHPRASV